MMIMDFIRPVHNVKCLSIAMFCRALRKNVTTFWWRTLNHAMGDFQMRNRHFISFLDVRE